MKTRLRRPTTPFHQCSASAAVSSCAELLWRCAVVVVRSAYSIIYCWQPQPLTMSEKYARNMHKSITCRLLSAGRYVTLPPLSIYIYIYVCMYIYVPILIAERESLSFNKSQNMGLSINGLPSISQGLQS